MMRSLSHLSRFVATAAILSASFGLAQNSTVLPRIKTQIDDNKLTKLAGNVANATRSASDLGEADASTQLTHVRLLLSRSTQQDQALTQYMADLQDRTSPSYHKWLTPEQFGKLYGPADSDIAAIVAWLESRGLKVEPVAPGRTNIAFSGTVTQVEEAFHVQIHSYQGRSQQYYSNVGEPSIPTALTSVVSGIARLNTLRPTPHHIASQMGQKNPTTKHLEPVAAHSNSKLGPNLTTGSGTSDDPYFLYVVPGDAATIYDTPNTTFNANFSSGTAYTGSGVTIGIGGDAAILAATVTDYRTAFLGDSGTVTISNVDGVTSTSDSDEAYIDTELSGGLAPGAALHYYTSTDLFSAIDQAITDNTVDIFSLSFGACELDFSTSDNTAISTMWQQAAAQGIAVTVSTGDSGAAGCDATSDSQGNNIATASGGLAVNGLASTPYNIAVGGTDMDGLLTSFSTYVDINSATDGVSTTFFRSALKYVPESTWNDSTQVDGAISANYPYTGVYANIVGGSGGKSSCSTNSTPANEQTTGTCTKGYVKPAWQRGTGVPSDGVRDLPDVSLMAGNGYDPATWLICTDDTGQNSTGVTVTSNCATQSDGFFYFQGFGGTSTAAPAFAGILALVEQKAGGRLGQAAVELYDLYNGSHASTIFHDITVGNNSVSCTSGSTNCTMNTAGYYYLSAYDTTTGYDLATGIGSVDANQLITYWGTGAQVTGATFKLSAASVTIAPGSSGTSTITATGTNNYYGAITLSGCTLTTSPSGATNSPTCSITTPTINVVSGPSSASGTVTISTTAASSSAIKAVTKAQLEQRNSLRRWTGVGGLAIAGILFFGIPARNRKWRSLLGAFAFLAILGFASGCGSGGRKDPGTTAGSYTFTVTGTDAAGTTATATITVTVS